MDSNIAIEVKDVTKKFKLYYDKGHMLKERAISWKRNKYEEREVLKGISFQVKKGEAVGLIGHNGCGKSTTLKLLTKIMYPDSGTIELSGRVSSLLELGAGFHPDLSGRENIYINASIFGLTKKEIDKRLQDIIDFSELEEFIDNPVRTYSSGMYMRLAFAVAINVDAEILLIDEILAVGDVNFQAKCFNKLMEIKNQGTTIVLVSHSTGQIEQLCERSIWIQDGLVAADGVAKEVNRKYLKYMGEQKENSSKHEASVTESDDETEQKTENSHKVKITNVSSYDISGTTKNVFSPEEFISFKINYDVRESVNNVIFGICIYRKDGFKCFETNTDINDIDIEQLDEGEDSFQIDIQTLNLLQGKYYVDVYVKSKIGEIIDYLDVANEFEIYSTLGETGLVKLPCKWNVKRKNIKVVYTVITGSYDELRDPLVIEDGWDYICFTDNHNLSSNIWEIIYIDNTDSLDSVRLSRRYKILCHKYLPQYKESLYIDGKFQISNSIESYLARYSVESSMLCIKHPSRDCIYEEAAACMNMKKDVIDTIEKQIHKYRTEGYPEHYGLVDCGILYRKHDDKKLCSTMETWWDEVSQYSRRDQLSFNYVCWKNNFIYDSANIDCNKNEFFIFYLHNDDEKNDNLQVLQSDISLKSAEILDKDRNESSVFYTGDVLCLKMAIYTEEKLSDYDIEVNIVKSDGTFCFGCSLLDDNKICKEWIGNKELELKIDAINLYSGKYHFDMNILDNNGNQLSFLGNAAEFEVHSIGFERGLTYLNHSWIRG